MGCDYCDTIRGIGPKRAYDLIKEHKSIVIKNLNLLILKMEKNNNQLLKRIK